MILLISTLLFFWNCAYNSDQPAEPELEVNTSVDTQAPTQTIGSLAEPIYHHNAITVSVDPGHERFSNLLSKHVSSDGVADYQGLKKNESELDTYLSALSQSPPDKSWSRGARLAYWINAYNAFTIKLILKHFPVASVMDIENGKPWDLKWIELNGETYSLNEIENDIIRPEFKEPRIHFAVNCAAKSCPPLANNAFTEQNLEGLLESQTKRFVNDASFNSLAKDKVAVSKIFEWYAADFANIPSFLNKYARTTIDPDAKITYKEYNWGLNN